MGGRLTKPTQEYLSDEGVGPVRVSPNFVMSPEASGLAEPLDFRRPEPATRVEKSLGQGVFTDVVLSPMRGASRASNFFDDPQKDTVSKRGGDAARWSDIFTRG